MAEQVNVSKVADDSVLLIEMDDGKANALSSPMIDAIAAALADAEAIANARVTGPAEAVDVGFLDRVVDPEAVVATAIEEAAGLAVLDGTAYRRTMAGFRRPTLERMADQIAADRAAAGSR